MELVTDSLQPDEVEAALDYAASTGLFSSIQLGLIGERLEGFISGQLVDDFRVLVCRHRTQLVGFLLYRKRPLTYSTFEIGFVVVHPSTPPLVLLTLVRALVDLARSCGGTLLFLELPDLPLWDSIRDTLRDGGFELIGKIPHLYRPGIGSVYLLEKLGAV